MWRRSLFWNAAFPLIIAVCFLFMGSVSGHASDTLDIQAELSRPGVKLVVVEFYATWCKPCMKAVPKWKALHKKYKKHGLRFIVVSADEGVCSKPPDWTPDRNICDPDGHIRKQFAAITGAKDLPLPTSFLFSWEGKLALKSHEVGPVDEVITNYFEDTHYKIKVEPVDVWGDKYAVGSNPEWVRDEVVKQLKKKSKVDVVSERKRATKRKSANLCNVEFPANSTLRIKLQGFETGERMLSLELEKDGCTKGKATHPYQGKGFKEDRKSLQRAVSRAVDDLLSQMGRVRTPELIGGEVAGRDNWFQEGELVVVRFEPDPEGAIAMVDDKIVCEKTPCSESFSKGLHTISVRKKDYLAKRDSVSFDKDMTINWNLTPDFGWLTVETSERGLDVKVDGKVIGKTPLGRYRLSPKRHRVEIDSRCYYPMKKNQVITRGEEVTWNPELKPREAGLDIKAVDSEGNALRADAYIDGKKIGRAPGRFKVNICERTLEVKADRYGKFSKDLNLREKQMMKVEVVLKEGRSSKGTAGIKWIYSSPAKLEFTKTEVTLGQFKKCVTASIARRK